VSAAFCGYAPATSVADSSTSVLINAIEPVSLTPRTV